MYKNTNTGACPGTDFLDLDLLEYKNIHEHRQKTFIHISSWGNRTSARQGLDFLDKYT